MVIDCTECEAYRTSHCGDCFVMAVLNHNPEAPLVIAQDQEPAITRLQEAGLAPALKFRRKAG